MTVMMTGGGGSHSDDPPGLENSSDGGSDGDRRDGESSDGDSSHSDSVGYGDPTESAETRLSRVLDEAGGPLQPPDIAAARLKRVLDAALGLKQEEEDEEEKEVRATLGLSECTSKRWCEPETRRGSFYWSLRGPDQIVTAYDTCTVADLKQVLRGRNLNSTGNKDVLIKKCQDFDKGIPQVLAGCSVATTQGSKPGGKRDRQPIPAETHGDAAHGPVVRELAAKVQVLEAKVEATWELQSQVRKLEAAVHELQAKIAPASMSSRASSSAGPSTSAGLRVATYNVGAMPAPETIRRAGRFVEVVLVQEHSQGRPKPEKNP